MEQKKKSAQNNKLTCEKSSRANKFAIKTLLKFLAIFLALIFSCKNSAETDEKNGAAYIQVFSSAIEEEKFARTIFPKKFLLSDFSYHLSGGPKGCEEVEIRSWASYAEMAGDDLRDLPFQTGQWTFTLCAKKDEKKFFEGSLEKNLLPGKNTLNFSLSEAFEVKTGSLCVTLILPNGADVASAEAGLFYAANIWSVAKNFQNISIEKNDEGKSFVKYEKNCIETGDYVVKFFFYDKNRRKVGKYCEVAQVRQSHEAFAERELFSIYSWHEIIYHKNGGDFAGDILPAAIFSEKQSLTLLPSAFKTGFKFLGWFENEGCVGEAVTKIPAGTARDVELWAKWIPAVYTITYNLDGGENASGNPATYTVESGTINLLPATKPHYDFWGWFSNAEFSEMVSKIPSGTAGNKKFWAKWEPIKYKITYNLNGGENSFSNPKSYTIESDFVTLKAPTREGYNFVGWFSDKQFKNSVTFIRAGSSGDVTLWAKWAAKNYKITYNLDGGENASENPATYTVESGTITLAEPNKEGFKFLGWYSDSSFSGYKVLKINPSGMQNITLWAKWLKSVYEATGENIKSVMQTAKNNAGNDIGPMTIKITGSVSESTLKKIADTLYEFRSQLGSNSLSTPWFIIDMSQTTGLTEIPNRCFNHSEWSSNLAGFVFPETVTKIMDLAFYGTGIAGSVVFPEGLTSIGLSAFYNCLRLRGPIIIPDSVTGSLSHTFEGCYGISSVKIGNGVTHIHEAFKGCNNIKSIEIGDGVTTLDDWTFGKGVSSGGLGNYEVYHPWLENLKIGNGVTKITAYKFRDYTQLKNVSLGNSITEIGICAFEGCSSLESITIPESVTKIGSGAFTGCSSLESIIIPESVTEIEISAFGRAKNLKSVIFKDINGWKKYQFGTTSGTPIDVSSPTENARFLANGSVFLDGIQYDLKKSN